MVEETFTKEEAELLKPYVSNLGQDVFVLKNLPEATKGALFSRYSRSSKQLRTLLLKEFVQNEDLGIGASTSSDSTQINTARSEGFYERILDGYGDDSIGELGGAHLATENVSMLAAKILEDGRIGGSPLEKSTRYVFYDNKVNDEYRFYREPTLMQSKHADAYLDACNFYFDTYSKLIEPMQEYFRELVPRDDETPETAYKFSIRARTCDALRGLLPASAVTNVGIFGNGRFFESLLIRLRTIGLAETTNLADSIYTELSTVIPSFVRRANPEHKHYQPFAEFLTQTRDGTQKVADELLTEDPKEPSDEVELLDYDPEAEFKVVAAALYPHTQQSYTQILERAKQMTAEERKNVLKEYASRRINRRHKPGRGFEHTQYTFDLLGDFGAFRDLHRHRMLTQQRQLLTANRGFDFPPEVVDAGFETEYHECMQRAKEVYDQIAPEHASEAQYVVPMAYKIRWYNHLTLREVFWLTELRSSEQGHPNYRRIAQKMYQKVKEVHPALAEHIKFVDMNEYALGRLSAEVKKAKKQASS